MQYSVGFILMANSHSDGHCSDAMIECVELDAWGCCALCEVGGGHLICPAPNLRASADAADLSS